MARWRRIMITSKWMTVLQILRLHSTQLPIQGWATSWIIHFNSISFILRVHGVAQETLYCTLLLHSSTSWADQETEDMVFSRRAAEFLEVGPQILTHTWFRTHSSRTPKKVSNGVFFLYCWVMAIPSTPMDFQFPVTEKKKNTPWTLLGDIG